jgi:DNA polymerase III epsilon subunit-like protein
MDRSNTKGSLSGGKSTSSRNKKKKNKSSSRLLSSASSEDIQEQKLSKSRRQVIDTTDEEEQKPRKSKVSLESPQEKQIIKSKWESIVITTDEEDQRPRSSKVVPIVKKSSTIKQSQPEAKLSSRENEMIFFDIETTGTATAEVIEFGAIIVDKFTYREKSRYETLIRPYGEISYHAGLVHKITIEMLNSKPRFKDVADKIFDALDGRIWVGHSINSADIPILNKAFAAIKHALPKEHARIDTLPLFRQRFGKRAGDLKMATLGSYFGLGKEQHRALSDSIMTFDVMKCIALSSMLGEEMPKTFPKFVEKSASSGSTKINKSERNM